MPAARTRARTKPPEPESDIPSMESSRERTPKNEKLQFSVESIYTLIYGALVVVPSPIGDKTRPIGIRLKEATPAIAEAWIDLAEDDPKVKKVLESLTGVGGWGKVVGLHLFVVGGNIPGITQQPRRAPEQEGQEGTPSDLEALAALASFMSQAAAQERNGGEQPQPTMPQQPRQAQQQPQQQQPPPPPPMGRPAAGIPTAQELGVQIADLPMDFPSGTAQDVKGK